MSISIILLISSLTLANFHDSRSDGDLQMAAQKLASNIRKAQGFALGLKEFNGVAPPATPIGGWGLTFETSDDTKYNVYADINDNHVEGAGELYGKEILLPNKITLDSLVLGGTNRNRVYLTFRPPDPEIFICRNPAQCVDALLITITNGTNSKTIEVNKFGLVDIQ